MQLAWDDRGLVAAVAQDAGTGAVLMLAWMNAEALERTLATGPGHFFSRSRALGRAGGAARAVAPPPRSVFPPRPPPPATPASPRASTAPPRPAPRTTARA